MLWWQQMVLTSIEYISLLLLIFRTSGRDFRVYIKPILIYGMIYIPIAASREYVSMQIVFIMVTVGTLSFVKMAFNTKLSRSILICFVSMFLSIVIIQHLFVFALGAFLSEPVEFMFSNGLIVLGLTLITCTICYLFVPLERLLQVKGRGRQLFYIVTFCIVLIVIYFIIESNYFEVLRNLGRSAIVDSLLSMGFALILVTLVYSAVKLILELKKKNLALKKYKLFEEVPAERRIHLHDDYETHLQVTRWLSHLQDDEKTIWYIKTYLNNLNEDEYDDMIHDDLTPKLWELDDKVLAAYLYVKINHLRSIGINCAVNTFYYSPLTKLKTSKILEALDILIDGALTASSKERSKLSVVLERLKNGRPVIDVYNRNDLLPAYDSLRKLYTGRLDKNKEVRGLCQLDAMIEEYDCGLILENKRRIDNDYYLKLRYMI